MAPLTTNDTKVLTVVPKYTDKFIEHCAHFNLRTNSNSSEIAVVDYYDEALPENDPKFLAPVRRWEKRMEFETPLRWINIVLIFTFHIITIGMCLHHFYLKCSVKWQTIAFEVFWGGLSGFGITAGAHRFWTHRAFKATLPLRILLMLAYSASGQNNLFNWVRDHRVHHKFSETTADPHNANRGFFFSHVGWLMMKKHPLVVKEGNKLDLSDVINDSVVKIHTKYFMGFKVIMCFLLPTIIKRIFWSETWRIAIFSTFVRYMISLNCTWSVNSFAHIWGNKPYDISIMPKENWTVSFFSMGEGWHNYHHVFPWDYKAAELPYFLNISTVFIDLFAHFGWAYDLKKASPALIDAVIKRKGPKKIIPN